MWGLKRKIGTDSRSIDFPREENERLEEKQEHAIRDDQEIRMSEDCANVRARWIHSRSPKEAAEEIRMTLADIQQAKHLLRAKRHKAFTALNILEGI